MAGTLADQLTLSNDNAFIGKCKGELVKKCLTIDAGTGGDDTNTRNLASSVLNAPEAYASRVAVLIAFGNATVAAAAPTVPDDADMAFVVNEAFAHLR